MNYREEFSATDVYKQKYLDGINALIERRERDAKDKRTEYIKDVFTDKMINYTVIRSDRRTLALQIKGGEVIVRAPREISEARIKDFVTVHTDWIDKQLSKHEMRADMLSDVDVLPEAEIKALIKEAKKRFAERAEYYAQRLGVSYSDISVRRQKTRWGSCTAKGALSFNAALLLAPPEVLDSVVAHELCHRKHMNHSKAFYRELEAVFPAWRECRAWLRHNGDMLLIRMGVNVK